MRALVRVGAILLVGATTEWWYDGIVGRAPISSGGTSSNLKEAHRDSPLDVDRMRQQVKKARKQMDKTLLEQYGEEFFHQVFYYEPSNNATKVRSRGRETITHPGNPQLFDPNNRTYPTKESPEWNGLVTKIVQKVIIAHTQSSETKVSFVWVNAGHSSSAGHGNFMHEAYTSVMSERISPLFQTLNLTFEGRNYGMSAARSSPELASCAAAVYGNDADLVSWNFDITDLRDYWKTAFFFWRIIASIPSHPVLIMLYPGDNKGKEGTPGGVRIVNILQKLRSLPVLTQSQNRWDEVIATVPDSKPLSEEEIERMPRYIRNFKCNDHIERGNPHCTEDKWNNTICDERRQRGGWHPGWKFHALTGNLFALSLADAVEDALEYIEKEQKNKSALQILRQLQKEEREKYETFIREAPIPEFSDRYHGNWKLPDDIDPEWIWRPPNFCRTGNAPAQSRIRGLAANDVDNPKYDGTYYDLGVTQLQAEQEMLPPEHEVLLTQDPLRAISYIRDCNETLRWDFRDKYYVHNDHGWRQMLLPNDAETLYYNLSGRIFRGILAICDPGERWADSFEDGQGEVEVNDIKVAGLTRASECHFFRNVQGRHIWPATKDGQFRVKIRAGKEDSFVQFSSIVLW